MVSMRINGFGITLADMKFQKAKLKPILLRQTMPNCDTTWPVWPAALVAFHVVLRPLNVPCGCLSILSIAANYTNANILVILPM